MNKVSNDPPLLIHVHTWAKLQTTLRFPLTQPSHGDTLIITPGLETPEGT
jgi:hypothetical protein